MSSHVGPDLDSICLQKTRVGKELITNVQKMTCNNSKLDLVNMDACIKFGEIQDIEWKWNYEGQNYRRTTKIQYSSLFSKRGHNDVYVWTYMMAADFFSMKSLSHLSHNQ